jgi:enamine deaminase RidA (YjgF/YER057c/UK114 family)
MKKQFIEPNEGFSQAVITEINNSKTIYISGQIGAGDDLESQTITAFQNLKRQLANCNANFKDVVKITTYIVNFNPAVDLPIYRKIRKDFLGDTNYPASSLMGVSVLGKKEWLIEIEAIAILDKNLDLSKL